MTARQMNDHFTFEMSDGRVFIFKDPENWPKNFKNRDLSLVDRFKALIDDFDAFMSYPEITSDSMMAIMGKYTGWVKQRGSNELWKRGASKKRKNTGRN